MFKTSFKWNFVIAVACLNTVCCQLTVDLTNGKIKGRVLKSRAGRSYYSYTGIPYAKPPVGKLRFQAPEPSGPWNGTLDATREPNVCAQPDVESGTEDCLYLNVYSPTTDVRSLPVMFWIHGGGFSGGHGGPDEYGPDYFMDKDVVLVTINYRLGIFGFLSTEDAVIPGNFGMKDQVEALRWVRDNVAKFNGDPGRVTIFGESAGGASAGFHMLSPMSKGLFHKAVLQSGAPTCEWAVNPAGIDRKRAHSLATVAGCNFNTSEDVLKCLRRLPARFLTDIHRKSSVWLNHPTVIFRPVVEDCSDPDGEAFLCHHPIYDFKQESFVPAIFGLNAAEGGLFVASLYNETSLIHDEFKSNFNHLFSVMAFYNYYVYPEHIDKVGRKALKRYFSSGELADNTHLEAVKMFTDVVFSQCVFGMAYQLSSPVYGYLYDYQNEFSFNKKFGSCAKPLGVTHCDELTSLFKMTGTSPKDLNKNDLDVSKLMVDVWYKFVISDRPTVDGRENGLAWPVFTRSSQLMLGVNSSSPAIIQNPFVEGYEFWTGLFTYKNSFYENEGRMNNNTSF